jgi:hypothetical protein
VHDRAVHTSAHRAAAGRPEQEAVMAQRYEYLVVEIREGMIGDKMSGNKIEKVLNEKAKNGWQLKTLTASDVRGRIGPGGTEGILATFERPVE